MSASRSIAGWIDRSRGWSIRKHIGFAVVLLAVEGAILNAALPSVDIASSTVSEGPRAPASSASQQEVQSELKSTSTMLTSVGADITALSTTATTIEVAPTQDSAQPTATLAPPADGAASAIEILSSLRVEPENDVGYDRSLFDHWITVNGCSTRESVLIRDSITFPQVDPFGCTVVAGDWISPYDGAQWTIPSDIDIDHVVALKEAWGSGAWAWDATRRRAFANDLSDLRTLRAVTDNVNQSKSDLDPAQWLPPLRSYWCIYVADWIAIKARWGLSIDRAESSALTGLLNGECSNTRIAPWASAPQ